MIAVMSYQTAAAYTSVTVAAMGALLNATGRALEKAYDKALSPTSLRTKFSAGFILATVLNVATAIAGVTNPWLLPVAIAIDTVVVGSVLTAAHFVGDVLWTSAKGAWSMLKNSTGWVAQKVRNLAVLFSLGRDESTDPLRKAAAEAMRSVG